MFCGFLGRIRARLWARLWASFPLEDLEEVTAQPPAKASAKRADEPMRQFDLTEVEATRVARGESCPQHAQNPAVPARHVENRADLSLFIAEHLFQALASAHKSANPAPPVQRFSAPRNHLTFSPQDQENG